MCHSCVYVAYALVLPYVQNTVHIDTVDRAIEREGEKERASRVEPPLASSGFYRHEAHPCGVCSMARSASVCMVGLRCVCVCVCMVPEMHGGWVYVGGCVYGVYGGSMRQCAWWVNASVCMVGLCVCVHGARMRR